MTSMNFAQLAEIQKMLDRRMTPAAIADSVARTTDLDAIEREAVRAAAVEIAAGLQSEGCSPR